MDDQLLLIGLASVVAVLTGLCYTAASVEEDVDRKLVLVGGSPFSLASGLMFGLGIGSGHVAIWTVTKALFKYSLDSDTR